MSKKHEVELIEAEIADLSNLPVPDNCVLELSARFYIKGYAITGEWWIDEDGDIIPVSEEYQYGKWDGPEELREPYLKEPPHVVKEWYQTRLDEEREDCAHILDLVHQIESTLNEQLDDPGEHTFLQIKFLGDGLVRITEGEEWELQHVDEDLGEVLADWIEGTREEDFDLEPVKDDLDNLREM